MKIQKQKKIRIQKKDLIKHYSNDLVFIVYYTTNCALILLTNTELPLDTVSLFEIQYISRYMPNPQKNFKYSFLI